MKSDYTMKNIITLPDPRLRQKSERVHVITDETRQIVADMIAATLDWEAHRENELATALSAVQIGQMQKIVIVREDFDDRDNHNFLVLINPEIVKAEGKISTDPPEGCLSVKNVYARVPRAEKVRVKAVGLDGREIRVKTREPFIARILQHEIDHTNGIPFIDRVEDENSYSILNKNGDLDPISFDEVKKMGILKDEK
jgi:peptide deformylase